MMKMSPDKPITAAIGDGGNDVAMIQVHIYPYNNVTFHQLMLRKRTPEKLKFKIRKVAPIPICDIEHWVFINLIRQQLLYNRVVKYNDLKGTQE